MRNLKKLIQVISKLRDPKNGCPWDLKQTHESLLKYLIEESYEYLDAVEQGIDVKMEEELGDVFLQVLLHSQIGKERKAFTLESVSKVLTEKLVRRHPHIFEKKQNNLSSDQVVTKWQEIKKDEKSDTQRLPLSLLGFPALFSADKIGKKTSEINFDWSSPQEVIEVVESEWKELKDEFISGNQEKIEEELGDLLFSVAQLARHQKIDPEIALRKANKKFLRRFHSMEKLIENNNINLETLNQKEMDVYWDKVKKSETKK